VEDNYFDSIGASPMLSRQYILTALGIRHVLLKKAEKRLRDIGQIWTISFEQQQGWNSDLE